MGDGWSSRVERRCCHPMLTDLSCSFRGKGSHQGILQEPSGREKCFAYIHRDILHTAPARTPRLGKHQVYSSLCALPHTPPSTVLSADQNLFLSSETSFVSGSLKHCVSNSCILDLSSEPPLICQGFFSLHSRNFCWSDEERI